MICKKCNQEMPEVGDFCPFCGEPKTKEEVALEEMETVETAEEAAEQALTDEVLFAEEETAQEAPAKKKIKPLHLALAIAGGVVLLGVLVFAVLFGMGVDLKPRGNDLQYKDVYAVEADDLEKAADKVVATMGDKELTIAELQLYYMNSIYTFYAENYYYMAYMGLDMTKPLYEQEYLGAEDMTWEQYFLDAALKSWESYTLVEILAETEGYTVAPEVQAQMDGMEEQLALVAANNGFASVEEYLYKQMAPGVTLDTYIHFNNVYYISNEYINSAYENTNPTQEEIDVYYAENEATFAENGVTPNIGLMSDVRHILIQPEGGTTDESGATTYSDEEWDAALAEAERILEEWKAGEATEDSFAELANTYSKDGGSNTTGGLYQGINADASYVAEFRSWAVDASRKPGDTGIVKTTYGYHIMYFVEGEDYFTYMVTEQLIASRIQEKVLAAQEEYPIEINYKKIKLCQASFA